MIALFAAVSSALFPGATTWRGILAKSGGSWAGIAGTALLAGAGPTANRREAATVIIYTM